MLIEPFFLTVFIRKKDNVDPGSYFFFLTVFIGKKDNVDPGSCFFRATRGQASDGKVIAARVT